LVIAPWRRRSPVVFSDGGELVGVLEAVPFADLGAEAQR
jgi:hypothetical protein